MFPSTKGAKLRAYRELYDYLKLFTDQLAVDITSRVTAEKPHHPTILNIFHCKR